MLKQLKIENFRCFKSFELSHVGKINLLVGENNSGKTSILEAIQLFSSRADFKSLEQIMTNRGEYFQDEEEFDISHLFYKHEINPEQYILISDTNQDNSKYIKLLIIEFQSHKETKGASKNFEQIEAKNEDYKFTEVIKVITEKKTIGKTIKTEHASNIYDISSQGKLLNICLRPGLRSYGLKIESNNEILKTKFVTSSSLTPLESLKLFNQIVLTPEEELVYQALQIIEPNIERIAPVSNELRNNNTHSGFFVRLSDTHKRIPIGSMGDGIWRILGLSLALVSAKDGVLLVDEIDTGLHYTALENMWKLIWETSKKLNVQVFATTHNSDCWKALEALTNREDVGEEDISIQRIEKDTPRSVAYNKEEIATAVEREIEVR